MARIYEKLGDFVKAIELLDKFLSLVEKDETPEGRAKVLEAHKELGEAHLKNGNEQAAYNNFESLRKLAQLDKSNRRVLSDAYLKIGLLFY